ncbi:substrate-binding domain-containing protein [uncultured Agrobacterium sp.]|uniref:substrate-binding domain-containing protein n=1 Tax=uncultured Agrobacterium sp. TaxID=157277 RepID=UPI0025D3DDD7|nr:substrate-binding domain-containing protein [uncultured Agrobacterium sp.]
MRSIITALHASAFCLTSMLPLAVHAQQSDWTGGDGAPTNPLACDATAASVDPGQYDGGSPTGAPDRKGKPLKVVDVPKLVGIGYFMSSAAGAQASAKEIGNMTVTTDGPTKANIDEQITFIDNYITSGVDGIMLSANDPVAVAPVLQKALAAGINVVTYDADAEHDARQWFINPATANGVAKTLIDQLAQQIGEDGSFAIVTSTFTTPNQARWISEMSAYAAKCHPKIKFLETVEAQEDNILSFNQAQTLINKYGDELNGIVGMTSVATPAASEAVQQNNLCGKVSVVGLALPNAMKPYITSGCVKSAVLWSTDDMGYAAATALRALADGTLKPGDKTFKAGKLGDLQIANKSEILLGAPKVFTKDNIASFNF